MRYRQGNRFLVGLFSEDELKGDEVIRALGSDRVLRFGDIDPALDLDIAKLFSSDLFSAGREGRVMGKAIAVEEFFSACENIIVVALGFASFAFMGLCVQALGDGKVKSVAIIGGVSKHMLISLAEESEIELIESMWSSGRLFSLEVFTRETWCKMAGVPT